jgi:hypothetical protein
MVSFKSLIFAIALVIAVPVQESENSMLTEQSEENFFDNGWGFDNWGGNGGYYRRNGGWGDFGGRHGGNYYRRNGGWGGFGGHHGGNYYRRNEGWGGLYGNHY